MSLTAFAFSIDSIAHEPEAIQSDEKVFELIFKQYYVRLRFFANKFVNDLEVSEEMVSDTFAQLWEQRDGLDVRTSAHSYLYRMVQNRCLNYLKHKRIENEYVNYLAKNNMLSEIPELSRNPLIDKDLHEQVYKVIESLPEKCREVFKLSRFEQLKNKEIADQLNISTKTVERHMTIALEKMKNGLKHLFTLSMLLNLLN